MNRTIKFLFAFTVLLVQSALCSVALADDAAAPKLVVENPLFQFGTVREGTSVEAVFTLRNAGQVPLEIKKLQPACGCTVAQPEQSTVVPGTSTQVKVTFNTAGFEGEKVKTVRVYTNDPVSPTAVLTVQGTVTEEMEVRPLRVSFGDVLQGSEATQDVVVSVPADSGTKILDASSRSESLFVNVDDYDDKGRKGLRVHVRLLKDVPTGVFRGRIVVRTTDPRRPLINIPVFARVEGDIETAPTDVSFGLLESPLARAQIREVQISSRSNTPFEIESITSSGGPISWSLQGKDATKGYKIVITIAAGATGMVKEKLTIRTNHPNPLYQEVSIPVYAILRKKGA